MIGMFFIFIGFYNLKLFFQIVGKVIVVCIVDVLLGVFVEYYKGVVRGRILVFLWR